MAAPRTDSTPLLPTGAQLAAALARGAIQAAFQPKVDLATGHLTGVEALARWTDAELGVVPPSTFIPIAEQHGLIGPLTLCILRQSLQTCLRLRDRHPNATVAVNLSPILLHDPTLPRSIAHLLETAGLEPAALIAEITEGRPLEDEDAAAAVLGELRLQGVGCALDDFGTGHANLRSLLRLPLTELKIDRAFITHADDSPHAWKIVRATLRLARELDLRVVAEGIETAEIERRLRDEGCDQGQGFRYGRPMPPIALLAWSQGAKIG